MFPLGLRIFHLDNMVYTTDFSITTDRATRNGVVSVNYNDEVICSDLYMMVTNASAINGDVYEYDILQDLNGQYYIVVFDFLNGQYLGVNGDLAIPITSEMFNYEIVGNPVETPELMSLISIPCDINSNIVRLMELSEKSTTSDIEERFVMVSPSTVDFEDGEEYTDNDCDAITEEDLEAMHDNCVDVSLIFERNSIVSCTYSDISDDFVEWIYKQYEDEMARGYGKEEDYMRYDEPVYIYFSGQYNKDKAKGAYAIRVEWDGQVVERNGLLKNAIDEKTAELQALLNALRIVKTPSEIIIYSSSKYVTYPFIKKWVFDWERNDWCKGPGGNRIANYQMFSKIYELTLIHNTSFELCEDPSFCAGLRECCDNACSCF